MSKFEVNAFQVPNVLVDEYINILSSNAFKILIFVVRKTKGWQKTRDSISASQLAHILGYKVNRHVYPYVKELEDLGLIKIYKKQGKTNQYALGKNFKKPVTKNDTTQTVTSDQKRHYPVTKNSTSTSDQKQHPTKDTIKTTNKKVSKGKKTGLDLELFIEKGYDQETLNLLVDHRKSLKKPLSTNLMMQGLLKAIQIYADHWKIKPVEALQFYLEQSWISIDPEYKYTGRQLKPNNPTSDLSYKDIGIMIQQEKNRRAGTGVGKINSVIQSITKQVEV